MRGISIVFCVILSIASGCSSTDSRRSTEPTDATYEGNADAAAYGMDHAFLGKDQKVRPPNDFQFYFKNCTQSDGKAHYSKTSYWCDDR